VNGLCFSIWTSFKNILIGLMNMTLPLTSAGLTSTSPTTCPLMADTEHTVPILLLGDPETGKSTFLQ